MSKRGILFDEPARLGDRADSPTASRDQIIMFDASGGTDRSRAPNIIPENACRYMQNLYYPRGAASPETRPGLGEFQDPDAPCSGRVTAIGGFSVSPSLSYLILACLNEDGDDQELWAIDLSDSDHTPVQLTDSLGSTLPPTFKTIAGCLVIAVNGQYLRHWDGNFGDEPARSTATVEIDAVPSHEDWVEIGGDTYTFYTDAVEGAPFEVLIGGDEEASAENLKDAINRCSYLVECVGIDEDGVTLLLESRRTGTIGDELTLESGQASIVVSGSTFSGGADGLALDEIDTYGAPRGGIVLGDKNGRVIVGGCVDQPDWVYLSRPGSPWDWQPPPYGEARRWEMGYREGNVITAIAPYYDELWAHKRGQDRSMYRARIADPNPGTWELRWRPHEEVNAALNPRCAVTVGGRQIVIDSQHLATYTGDDTFNELRGTWEGARVADLIAGVGSGAFISVNPAELYALVFPNPGDVALCYDYAGARWSLWKFRIRIHSAYYCEPVSKMLFGAEDGLVYCADPALATDAGLPIESILVTRSFQAGAGKIKLKQAILDYRHLVSGQGEIQVLLDRHESTPKKLAEFALLTSGLTIAAATMEVFEATFGFNPAQYGRAVTNEQATGEMLALRLVFAGSCKVNAIQLRIAEHGRASA